RWDWGGPNTPTIHAVLMLFAKSEERLRTLFEAQREAWSRDGFANIHMLQTKERVGREHFGFADGISQPAIEGYHKASSDIHLVKAGEFILGYPNEYDLYTDHPLVDGAIKGASILPADIQGGSSRDFGCNGTYLVMRQLRQDVVAFRNTLDAL